MRVPSRMRESVELRADDRDVERLARAELQARLLAADVQPVDAPPGVEESVEPTVRRERETRRPGGAEERDGDRRGDPTSCVLCACLRPLGSIPGWESTLSRRSLLSMRSE